MIKAFASPVFSCHTEWSQSAFRITDLSKTITVRFHDQHRPQHHTSNNSCRLQTVF